MNRLLVSAAAASSLALSGCATSAYDHQVATTATGAAIGAGAGAVAGGVTGMLTDHGVSGDDAAYYEGRINDGGTFVSVDAGDGVTSAETVREILMRNGGHNAAQPRTASAIA